MADNIDTVLPDITVTPDAEPVFGSRQPQDLSDDYNAFRFLFRQLMAEINTNLVAKVDSVNEDKTVNIIIIINQLMANMEASPHGIIYNVPVFKYQFGDFGVKGNPKAGDIGLIAFVSRDIANLKKVAATEQPAEPVNPASLRRFDFSDAVYIGGLFNRDPTSYIEGTDTTIDIVSQTVSTAAQTVSTTATSINQTGDLVAEGNESHTGRIDIYGSLYINGVQVIPP